MNPIYKFELTAVDYNTQTVYPLWKADLAKEYSKQSQQEFFRTKFSGKLTFVADDFEYIRTKPIDTEFRLEIFISYNNGVNWESYLKGHFWKTDGEFDMDSKTFVVTPQADDEYSAILDGYEKEFNLIELKPVINQVHFDKRPLIQVYIPGQSVIGCFLAGMWWEQEVTEPVSTLATLLNTYHFAQMATFQVFSRQNTQYPLIPDAFTGTLPDDPTQEWNLVNGDFRFRYHFSNNLPFYDIYYNGQLLWTDGEWISQTTLRLKPVSGTIASGNAEFTREVRYVYGRMLCDVDSIEGVSTYDVPADDILANNRNYRKCIGYAKSNAIVFTNNLSTNPTEYGIYQPGKYYAAPNVPLYYGKFYPCARNSWTRYSVWFKPDLIDALYEAKARKEYTLKDAYPLYSCIKVLLNKIAPDVEFTPTIECSEFLFGAQNPISVISQHLFLTPKSNIVNSGYDQPAQKAPVTLKTIMDMLRDCFRCYWFVENGKFRIEHISYFMRGGSYTATPVVGRDLTEEIETRNGKEWAFGTGKFSYDKPEMTGRYQFGWMDDVTELFNGYPIDIDSNYVNKERIENITVSQITSDIDYILLNPSEISQDGFVLLAAQYANAKYKLPYINFIIDYTDHLLQNAYVAFIFLQNYYAYDMPARHYTIHGIQKTAVGTKRQMTQSLTMPCLTDVNVMRLVKTSLGVGSIEKISINLSSRQGKATIKYNAK